MICPSGKVPYQTEAAAEEALDRHRAAQGFSMLETRPDWQKYRCTSCPGWHLTSGPRYPPHFGKRLRSRTRRISDAEDPNHSKRVDP